MEPAANQLAPDPLARSGAVAIAATRIGIGVGALAFTRPALELLGFDDPDAATVVLARMAGARDIALGAHGLAVRDDAAQLQISTLLATGVDAGDALAFAAALVFRDGIDRTALKNLPIAGAAVVAGAWLAARLGRSGA